GGSALQQGVQSAADRGGAWDRAVAEVSSVDAHGPPLPPGAYDARARGGRSGESDAAAEAGRLISTKRMREGLSLTYREEGLVGKTHLRKRLFLPDSAGIEYYNAHEDRTHDADCCEFAIDVPQGHAVASGRVTVRVWDFGGQSYLHSTHRFFLGGQRCFYL